jgi:hypothetical protein
MNDRKKLRDIVDAIEAYDVTLRERSYATEESRTSSFRDPSLCRVAYAHFVHTVTVYFVRMTFLR